MAQRALGFAAPAHAQLASRLPGFGYSGDNPDGYRGPCRRSSVLFKDAKAISAPVEPNTTVTSVCSTGTGYLVRTERGD